MKFHSLIFLSILFVFACGKKEAEKQGKRPNIILFYADDLGWTDTGFQGSDFYETPNLDGLAEQSVRFTNAYANAANCAPSRACLMTGLYTPRHGIFTVGNPARGKPENRRLIPIENQIVLDTGLVTLPAMLKEAGYATCIAGKWHLSDDPGKYGFDTNFGGYQAGHPKSYFSPYKNPRLTDGPDGEHLTGRLANEVINWIGTQKDGPFFLYFPFYAVHTPIQARADLVSKYENKDQGKMHDNEAYAAMVEAMDEAIGQVLNELAVHKIQEETIIIFTSDNGQHGVVSVAKPLRGAKGMYYEGGIRVPFLVKWAGSSPGLRTVETPVIGSDIFPTIMEMTGISIPENPDGISMVPLLKGKFIEERALFWHAPAYLEMSERNRLKDDSHDSPHWRSTPCGVIRSGDWKLIEYFENGEIELFNLKEDISESNNLAMAENETAKRLLSELNTWRDMTCAPVPTEKNPDYQGN